ncbi:2-methylisocitrate lyase [Steroidobacter agaridevorans]|uniref:2-methylisocitrate lyase n=1 Tax=Steroidobacter agaridevorans TaxID=2695856 RepID=A0A829YE69_9GAMM|nr:isocitrate lyase/phosphoenolpyruvate mutase family protein [Steroidobacter agaridevorans]GFE81168.1 2-methylisocitrate lyase [Steroidobacter agaridevorans]GFE88947.1 2-methylisocitrate lyase [Steroidobacter agaridevorans]
MTATQRDKAAAFRTLHEQPRAFVIANAWDAGSAMLLAGLGFPAIATSSAAFANTLGRQDGKITRDEALAHCKTLVAAVNVPVAADLENGFGHAPSHVAETIRLAAQTGLAGGSIEDHTGDPTKPIYDFEQAVERVTAAVEAAKSLGTPFILTARCENFLHGHPDLDDTIKRLQAFEKAGADVLFAPGLPDLKAVRAVCSSLSKPVNFMVGIPGRSFSVPELQEAGVRRISLATSLHRAAMSGVYNAAHEILDKGTFEFLNALVSPKELGKSLRK